MPIAQIDECAPNTAIGEAPCEHRAACAATAGSYQNGAGVMPRGVALADVIGVVRNVEDAVPYQNKTGKQVRPPVASGVQS